MFACSCDSIGYHVPAGSAGTREQRGKAIGLYAVPDPYSEMRIQSLATGLEKKGADWLLRPMAH